MRRGDSDTAEAELTRLSDYLQNAAAIHAWSEFPQLMARTQLKFADLYFSRGQRQQAGEALEAARQLLQPAMAIVSDASSASRDTYANILEQLAQNAPLDKAVVLLEEVIELRTGLLAENPQALDSRYALANAFKELGWRKLRSDPNQSINSFEQAEAILSVLFRENPSVVAYRYAFARTLDEHAFCEHQRSLKLDDESAKNSGFERSYGLYDQAEVVLLQPFSTLDFNSAVAKLSHSQQNLMSMIYNGKALVQRDQGKLEDSIAKYEKALEVQTIAAEQNRELVSAQMNVAGTLYNMGRTYAHFHSYDDALDLYGRAVAQFEKVQADFPQDFSVVKFLAGAGSELNRMLFHAGDLTALQSGYKSTTEYWNKVVVEQQEPMQDSLVEAQAMDDMYAVLGGDTDRLATRTTRLLETVQTDPASAASVAAMLAGLARALSKVDSPNEQVIQLCRSSVQQLCDAAIAASPDLLQELRAEPLLDEFLPRDSLPN
jgi:tetratricopeptide (TPR) repeat protein